MSHTQKIALRVGGIIKKVKGISYDTEEDYEIIRYLNSIDNYSKYILNLVKDDMLCQHKFHAVIDYVYDLMQDCKKPKKT